MKNFNNLKYNKCVVNFPNLALIKINGKDCADFLQRQLSNDLSQLKNKQSQLSARLDRTAKIESFFYISRLDDYFCLLIDKSLIKSTISELDKYVIMEDVEFEIIENTISALVGPDAFNDMRISESIFEGIWCYENAFFFDQQIEGTCTLSDAEKKDFTISRAWPELGLTVELGKMINQTLLSKVAISYDKGCFLGQETAAKIHTRRGASQYPTLIEIDGGIKEEEIRFKKVWGISKNTHSKELLLVDVAREERVSGKKIFVDNDKNKQGLILPDFVLEDFTSIKKAEELYYEAIEIFHGKDINAAIKLLDDSIHLNKKFADAYESKGVILGQNNRYDEAITTMKELLLVDKDSVMAHTNLSLFYMKQGKIEEAEDEKSKATLATFKMYGDIAKGKKEVEKEKQKKKDEVKLRKSMFEQVLEIDSEDLIANYGMADICFINEDYEQSKKYLLKLLKENENYSNAYLLLGKIEVLLKNRESAIEIFSKGISVASKQGELMPANDMQSRLNKIM